MRDKLKRQVSQQLIFCAWQNKQHDFDNDNEVWQWLWRHLYVQKVIEHNYLWNKC